MTIPNVTMRWSRKSAICRWCDKPVEVSTPMVVVFFWNKGGEGRRSFNVKHYYHPQCWVEQGLDYLRMNPYIPHKRGPKPKLGAEDRRKRFLLVRRKNALEQRKRKLKAEYPDRVLLEAKIDEQIMDIVLEVIKLGGVPKTWVEKLG